MHTLRQEIYKKHLEFTMPFFKFSENSFKYIADFFVISKYSPVPFFFKNMSAISIISVCTLIIVGLFYLLTERNVLSDKFEIFWKILLGIVSVFWMIFVIPLMIMTFIILILFTCFVTPTIIYILLLILLIIFKITFISPLMLVIITLILTLYFAFSKLTSNKS